MNADGSGSVPLTRFTAQVLLDVNSSASVNGPAWSLDGKKIAFLSQGALDGSNATDANGNVNIWVMNSDGSNPTPLTRLTAAPLQIGGVGPSILAFKWSSNGTKIAFASTGALDSSDAINANGNGNIWAMNADGSSPTPLTKFTGLQIPPPLLGGIGPGSYNPVWSPDGSKIAFASTGALDGTNAVNTNDIENIWVMNSDGSNATAITHFTALFIQAISDMAWSPDGKRLSFVCNCALDGSDNPTRTRNIWLVNADGSARTPLTQSSNALVQSGGPVWSLDGTRIFFHSNRDLGGTDNPIGPIQDNLWVINADGSGVKPLTNLVALGATSVFPSVQ